MTEMVFVEFPLGRRWPTLHPRPPIPQLCHVWDLKFRDIGFARQWLLAQHSFLWPSVERLGGQVSDPRGTRPSLP